MECVNPNLRMLSSSGVRLWEDRLVTVSSDVKGIDLLRVRFLSLVCLNEMCCCFSDIVM